VAAIALALLGIPPLALPPVAVASAVASAVARARLLASPSVPVAMVAAPAPATPSRKVMAKVRDWRTRHEASILKEFAELLSIPNVASDSANIRRNADALVAMLERRGVSARRLETQGGPPAVYGELAAPGARRTLVLYAHYDGQPVVPKDWAGDPWVPVLRDRPFEQGGREVPWPVDGARADPEWRLYGRSSGDDKAPIVALLAALDALQATHGRRSVNLKVFLEGEEETGSRHLRDMLERHRTLLAADGWIFCDGPVHQSRQPQVAFGVRGTVGLELTVYGPARPLHSGHYGNWAPNPIALMTALLASLRDADGRILVPGFDADVRPVSASERAAMAAVPDPDATLRDELQLGGSEAGNARLIERLLLPAINFRGVRAGGVGETATNAIPTEARASIDFRLVPDQTPAAVKRRVEDHLRAQGWTIVTETPDAARRRAHAMIVRLDWGQGYPAYRVPLDAPFPRAVVRAMEESLGRPILMVPTLGGSLPLHLFQEVLGAPVIVLPIANHDDNQHAANENLRLQNLWDGIEIFAGLLVRFGELWR
jgi:acetylornithine deacetylase/succinyl-diaminopimelate desuccinylase-like protein